MPHIHRRMSLIITALTVLLVHSVTAATEKAHTDWAGVLELHEAMREGSLSAVELVERHITQIELFNPQLKAVIAIDPSARARAALLDAELARGNWVGPLHGIPVLIKDNVETRDQPTTAGSLALSDNHTGRDAPVITQLREAGAIILGKANLSEWANFRSERSSSGWSATGGQTRNPYDPSRSPCGSSSGSGVAVAADMTVLAVGTETNGSIVCPASANGIVGIKPTVGLVSRTHIVPISHSQDTAGPMGRNVYDVAVMLGAMAGQDKADPATKERPEWSPATLATHVKTDGLRGKRIGVLRSSAGFHSGADQLLEKAIDSMRANGAHVIDDIEWQTSDNLFAESYDMFGQAYDVLLYEFKHGLNAYLASLPDPELAKMTLADIIQFNRNNADQEMRWFGQKIFESAQEKGPLSDDRYVNALTGVQSAAREAGIDKLLSEHGLDALIAPTAPPAWSIDLINGDNSLGGSSSLAAISGYPNITVPMGQIHGMPVGLSIFGAKFSEPVLIEIASGFEYVSGGFVPPTMGALN